ncbi:MAG: 2-dehydropantoate 2-reductase [Gammaproteobacteria bacterium]|nr:2-dehydropantoate 2-reductase [Gammaproteobacteria bacterium]
MQHQTVYISGSGAIGGLWARHLLNANYPVTFISKQLDNVENSIELKFNNLINNEVDQIQTQSIAQLSPEQTKKIKILLVCVKSYQLSTALNSIKHAIDSNSQVILFQNGMGNLEIAKQLIPEAKLFLASNTHGANRTSDFCVTYAGAGKTLVGPATNSQSTAGISSFIDALNNALPPVIWTQNIQDHLWEKLAVNAVINTLTARYQCPNGDLIKNPDLLLKLKQLVLELEQLYGQLGKQTIADNIQTNVSNIASLTAKNKSSMLQDRMNQRPMELDAISGYVLTQAKTAGISMPLLTELHDYLSNIHH